MEPKNNLTELKEKAIEMGNYYYKGFGNTLTGILANAELYLVKPEKQELIEDSYKWLREIEEVYDKIPFNNLHGKEEFYPLFIVKKLLPKFKNQMDSIFKKHDKDAMRNLETDARTIVNVGRLYWDDFIELTRSIRKFPEAKDFRIKIVDYKNDVWHF